MNLQKEDIFCFPKSTESINIFAVLLLGLILLKRCFEKGCSSFTAHHLSTSSCLYSMHMRFLEPITLLTPSHLCIQSFLLLKCSAFTLSPS